MNRRSTVSNNSKLIYPFPTQFSCWAKKVEFSFGIETANMDISLILDTAFLSGFITPSGSISRTFNFYMRCRLSENSQPISNSLLFRALIPASSFLHSHSQKPGLISNQTVLVEERVGICVGKWGLLWVGLNLKSSCQYLSHGKRL